jgi:HlyD family secretion protein
MAKKSSATRILIYVIVAFVVLVGVLAGLRFAGVIGNKESGIVVETSGVEVRNITQLVTASGKVQPEVEVIISPDVPGEIIELPIKEGDQVDRGNLLARIRPDDYVAQVEQGEAGVLQSKAGMAQQRADLLNAELEMNRQKDLFGKKAISESE